MKKAFSLLLVLVAFTVVFSLVGCGCSRNDPSNDGTPSESTIVPEEETDGADQATNESDGTDQTTDESEEDSGSTIPVEYDDDDVYSGSDNTDVCYIGLEGDSISVEGNGAVVAGRTMTITSSGTYSISGTLNDGQIVVNTQDKETVKLILNGADITCSTSAPIYVVDAKKAVITLAEDTRNNVTDGASYVLADVASGEPDAAVFSKSDLTINGSGSLTVNANYRNGITSKDQLEITGGNITVNAVNDGIRGRDYVAVKDGTITVKAGGDGIQSNNDEDTAKGFVSVEGGTFGITAGGDGIQAETKVLISGGTFTIASGGGSTKTASSATSAKGIKGSAEVAIDGGTFRIDSSDDALHSNNSITINGGSITLASGDDGIHADSAIVISGGDITVTKSYEGIEGGVVTINNGNLHIVASDDGMNILAGYLYINSGYTAVYAGGDGLDVNDANPATVDMADTGGTILMTGGTLIINGPTANNNGALDFATFKMTGGFLVAVGSSGMAQALSTTSTQYSVMVNLTSARSAGTMVHIQTQAGEDVLTFLPTKAYQSVVLCSPELAKGTSYVVYTGGSSTGTAVDGLYSGGTYTPGTQYTTFTISSIVTTIGTTGGGPGPRP